MKHYDGLKHEFDLGGQFRADLLVADKAHAQFLLVEFEDATRTSVFRTVKARATSEWGPRFEHGFSQVIDWLCFLAGQRDTPQFRAAFGDGEARFEYLVVVGRDSFLTEDERRRMRWRGDRVVVDSRIVRCLTFDQLLLDMERTMALLTAGARGG